MLRRSCGRGVGRIMGRGAGATGRAFGRAGGAAIGRTVEGVERAMGHSLAAVFCKWCFKFVACQCQSKGAKLTLPIALS